MLQSCLGGSAFASKQTDHQPTVAGSNLENRAKVRDLWSHYGTSRGSNGGPCSLWCAAALVDKRALAGNSPHDILGGQYPRHSRPPRQACLQAMQFSVLTKMAPRLVSRVSPGSRREDRVP